MSLISPNFAVKLIIFPNFGQGPYLKIAGKSPGIGPEIRILRLTFYFHRKSASKC